MLIAQDQENLVHSHQVTAAGKPLNQGPRSLQPKTPANRPSKTPANRPSKTPGGLPHNDENRPIGFTVHKTGLSTLGKARESVPQTPRDGKADNNAFITPSVPRMRAPLGLKSTNVKPQAFQTPAQAQQHHAPRRENGKHRSTSNTVNVKITAAARERVETEPLANEDEYYVSDVEYAPPTPIDLPDPPMEFPYDDTFPQFRGANLCRGHPWPENKKYALSFGVKQPLKNHQGHDKSKFQETRTQQAGEYADRTVVSGVHDEDMAAHKPWMGLKGHGVSKLEGKRLNFTPPQVQSTNISKVLGRSSLQRRNRKTATFSVLAPSKPPATSNHAPVHGADIAGLSRSSTRLPGAFNALSVLVEDGMSSVRGATERTKPVHGTKLVQQALSNQLSTVLDEIQGTRETMPEVVHAEMSAPVQEEEQERFQRHRELIRERSTMHHERTEDELDHLGAACSYNFDGIDDPLGRLDPLDPYSYEQAHEEINVSKYNQLATTFLEADYFEE